VTFHGVNSAIVKPLKFHSNWLVCWWAMPTLRYICSDSERRTTGVYRMGSRKYP